MAGLCFFISMKKTLIILLVSLCGFTGWSQQSYYFNPEEPGAIHKDSSIIVAWATGCTVQRGYINIEDTTQTYTQGDSTSNKTFFGNPADATGYPENNMSVVSLGDGGSALLTFDKPIANGPGYDFAVFENGFQYQQPPFNYYLELAFVEVSSDGIHFVRFPAVSQTQDTAQIETFGQLNPEDIHNLAGKYPVDYGTPFDLDDLKDSTGINIDSIVYIKITDVTGDINPAFASYDSQGNIINDPWPTPFWTGGFDLNAVGVIHQASGPDFVSYGKKERNLTVWPVPANKMLHLKTKDNTAIHSVTITGLAGQVVFHKDFNGQSTVEIPVSGITGGFYLIQAFTGSGSVIQRITVKHQ